MRRNYLHIIIVCALVLILLIIGAVNIHTNWLWFQEIEYERVYLTIMLARVKLGAAVALALAATLLANVFIRKFSLFRGAENKKHL